MDQCPELATFGIALASSTTQKKGGDVIIQQHPIAVVKLYYDFDQWLKKE